MEQLMIHDFEEAKNQIKEFSAGMSESMELSKFKTTDEFLLIPFDHKVTGDELNELVVKIQDYFTKFNARDKDFIEQFGQVYKAFESLDKDYIQSIIAAIKSAEQASRQAIEAQRGLNANVDRLEKTIKILHRFKQEVKAYKHLDDIDSIWDDLQMLKRRTNEIENGIARNVDDLQMLKRRTDEIENSYAGNVDDLQMLISKTDKIESGFARNIVAIQRLQREEQQKYITNMEKVLSRLVDLEKKYAQGALQSQQLQERLDENTAVAEHSAEVLNPILNRKVRICYLIAGSSFMLAFIQIILNMAGIM